MTTPYRRSTDPNSPPTTRRQALKTLGGMAGLLTLGSFGIGCGSDDSPTSPEVAKEPLVLLVPGFMSQFYTALSVHGESVLNSALRTRARTVPVIGDRIAAALPTIRLPLAAGGFISFDSLMQHYDGLGVAYVDMSGLPGFNTQSGIVPNGAAIAAYLAGLRNRSVTIVSHSKGGLDTLQALLENRDLWGDTVTGWVALQAPFHGSPVADNLPAGLAGPLLAALGGDEQALVDLQTAGREQYMRERAGTIADLTGAMPVMSCYSSFVASPGQTIQSVAAGLALDVINANILQQVAAIVARNILDPAQAAAEAVALIRTRANQLVGAAMANVSMMGTSNLTMREANDGLVPVSRAVLSGSGSVVMAPDADHAAPVMEVTPFRNYWTAGYRNQITAGQVADVREMSAGPV